MPRPTLFDHPKFLRLVHVLKMPKPHVLGHLEFIWRTGYSSGNPVIGDGIDVELAAEWTGKPGELCAALVATRFLDATVGGKFAIHDLAENAPDYVRRRAELEAERKKEKVCEHCGADYRSPRAHARFCSDHCRLNNHRATHETGRTVSSVSCVSNANCETHETHATLGNGTPAPAPAPAPAHLNTDGGAEAPAAALISFPTRGGGLWGLAQGHLDRLASAYPAVNVAGECAKAREWCTANAKRQKTQKGMPKFLANWMAHAAENGAVNGNGRPVRGRYSAEREAGLVARMDSIPWEAAP